MARDSAAGLSDARAGGCVVARLEYKFLFGKGERKQVVLFCFALVLVLVLVLGGRWSRKAERRACE